MTLKHCMYIMRLTLHIPVYGTHCAEILADITAKQCNKLFKNDNHIHTSIWDKFNADIEVTLYYNCVTKSKPTGGCDACGETYRRNHSLTVTVY